MARSDSAPLLPRSATLLGIALLACAWLPLTPGGRSFVQLAIETFGEGVMAGLVMVVGMGSPFLFGLAVAVGSLGRDEQRAASLVRTPVTMMLSQLLLLAWIMWRRGDMIASLPLLLFAVVTSLYVIQHSASSRASGRPASFRWYVRWGAMVVSAVAGWLLLQRMGGLRMGVAVEIAGLCGLGLVLRAQPSREAPAPAAAEVDDEPETEGLGDLDDDELDDEGLDEPSDD
ncbi:MAG: hypothetical protein H6712_13080 [Myxococcales bacterium]|nr:hypothetical protein [Myxococcales bacterium]MCB9714793.1 hypothetical protein [Myxococcales bacterium]